MKKFNTRMSFKERAQLAQEILSKQPPVTLDEAKAQVEWLKENSKSTIRKGDGDKK